MTDLTAARKQSKLPHPSFDLTGDGVVTEKENAIDIIRL
jgi:hypothetical protein